MSKVVTLSRQAAIAVITMEEREGRNTFTAALIEGLLDAFRTIADDEQTKVVVLTGYGNYFCCGGTRNELIGFCDGARTFTDFSFHDLLLKCQVPVISAMQGHALGGGLVFGCYGDLIVMGEESLYSANFMHYGFTPGMGATYIIPLKFGNILGGEMLLTAAYYHGGELRARGASARVVKRREVFTTAMELAAGLADKPRTSLTLLKKHLTREIARDLPAAVEWELEMHRIGFALPEVRERIESFFGGEAPKAEDGQ